MKKSLAKLVVYLGAVIITVLATMIASKLLERDTILDRISEWPDLRVQTLYGEPVSTLDIVSDKPRVLYYFSTECIYCQETFTDLPNHQELIDETALLFISNEDPQVVRKFLTDMGLENMSGIHFYHDADQRVKDFFAIRGVPAIYLYNQQGELVELYQGTTDLTTIWSEIQKESTSR